MTIIISLIRIYSELIFVYILLSWFPEARDSKLGYYLREIIEPYLQIFRSIIPPIGPFDLSPVFGYIILQLAVMGLASI